MRCSWSHCEARFEGQVPPGWKLVARHKNTGEQVVVCPRHYRELLDADLRALLKLYAVPSVPPVPDLSADEDSVEVTARLPRGRVEPK